MPYAIDAPTTEFDSILCLPLRPVGACTNLKKAATGLLPPDEVRAAKQPIWVCPELFMKAEYRCVMAHVALVDALAVGRSGLDNGE